MPPLPPALLAPGLTGPPDAWLNCPCFLLGPKVGTAADDSWGARRLAGKSGEARICEAGKRGAAGREDVSMFGVISRALTLEYL